jgi:hypothetical protein
MASIQAMECCGWAELFGVQSYNDHLFRDVISIAKQWGKYKGALLFCSAHTTNHNVRFGAKRYAIKIQKLGLGEVTALPIFKNPNTRRYIHPYIWVINWGALNAYCKENDIKDFSW